MTTFYLIRHGATDAIGQSFTGRLPGVSLNTEGRQQAQALAASFPKVPLAGLYASPSDRAQETAAALSAAVQRTVQCDPHFDEIHIGDWSGRTFEELNEFAGFRDFNSHRSLSRPPGGEMMLEVQSRVVSRLLQLAATHPEGHVAVVTHADVIKAALAYCLGIPLDLTHRLEIGLCSMSIVRLACDYVQVVAINRS